MTLVHFEFAAAAIAIDCPKMLEGVLSTCWPHAIVAKTELPVVANIQIAESGKNRWTIAKDNGPAEGPFEKADFVIALTRLMNEVARNHTACIPLRAGAVSWDGSDVWVLGGPAAGKSMLLAWLVAQGFALKSDNDLFFDPQTQRAFGSGGPFMLQPGDAVAAVHKLPDFDKAIYLKGADRSVVLSNPEWVLPPDRVRPAFLIFVEHNRNGACAVTPLSGPDVAAKLGNLHTELTEETLAQLTEYLAEIPAVSLSYHDFGAIGGLIDQLCCYVISTTPTPAVFEKFVAGISGAKPAGQSVHPIPEKTDRKLAPKLTIGMATYDDYDGVYFSLQAIRMYHPDILPEVEFIVIDNNPEGICAGALKRLENYIPNYRYIPTTGIKGTAVRDFIFREAYGDYVLSMDCHVFFVPGSLRRLIDYYDQNPETQDLLQGPLLVDDLETVSVQFDPIWEKGMFGRWSEAQKGFDAAAAPFDIPSQGLGVFSCRKDAWPGFNPAFQGFGGEEGYIHQKFRNLGRRTLCLPFLQWMHRFERPMGVAYRNIWEDRIRNYIIGWKEVGLPIEDMRAHFVEQTNAQVVNAVFEGFERENSPIVLQQAKARR